MFLLQHIYMIICLSFTTNGYSVTIWQICSYYVFSTNYLAAVTLLPWLIYYKKFEQFNLYINDSFLTASLF